MRGLRWAVMVSVAFALGGCGGGSLSVDDYFGELEEIAIEYDSATDQLADDYEQALAGEIEALQEASDLSDPAGVDRFFAQATEVAIVKTADLFTQTRSELQAFLDGLESLAPPDELADAHGEALRAGELSLEQLPELIQQVRNIQSIDDLDELIAASRFRAAQNRFGASCRHLQDLAAENAVEVELRCPQP